MKTESIIVYLKKNPLLVLTLCTLICAFIGFWLEFTLLNYFGLNIGTFASVEYFLLAGITSPYVLVVFFLFAISNVFKTRIVLKLFPVTEKNKDVHYLWRVILVISIAAIFAFYIKECSFQKYQEITEKSEEFVEVKLRGSNELLGKKENDFTVITATDSFMLFYQHSTSNVIATPIQNILSVKFIKKELGSNE